MALEDFEPRVHTAAPSGTVWQIVDVRLKRRVSDGHFTVEVSGAEGKPGMFRTAKDAKGALLQLSRLLDRLESG